MIIDKSFVNSFVKTTERGAYGASIFKGKNYNNLLSSLSKNKFILSNPTYIRIEKV